MSRLLLCFVFVTGALGCAQDGRKTMAQLLRRAAFDLRCPEIEIEMQHLGPNLVGVRGCNAQASYIYTCDQSHCSSAGCPCLWIMNGALRRDYNTAPLADDAPAPPEHRKAQGRPIPTRPKTTPPTKKRRRTP